MTASLQPTALLPSYHALLHCNTGPCSLLCVIQHSIQSKTCACLEIPSTGKRPAATPCQEHVALHGSVVSTKPPTEQ